MGCDIHVYLEKYTSVNEEYKWINVDHWQLNPSFGVYENESEYELVAFYWGRNYDLFSILAEVRGTLEPIDEPRGLPEDVSPRTKEEFEKWGRDAHTPSYFTLKELKDYLFEKSDDEDIVNSLTRFVNSMDKRFKEEFWIAEDDEKRYTVKEQAFRVVFWFDS
jgi:hypothetical protein